MALKIAIEGWRGINHSYALVNQFQLLALMRREELALFHHDLPFFRSHWNPAANASGLKDDDHARIMALPPPSGDMDAVLRIGFPFRLYGGDARKIIVFGTCEGQAVEDGFVYQGPECGGVYPDPAVEIVTPSHWSRAGFLKAGFDPAQVHVVAHGIDPNYFYPLTEEERRQARTALGLPPGAFVFLNVGAMTGNKGIDLLIAAFAEIHRRHPHALLLLKDQQNLYGISAHGMVQSARGRIAESALRAIGAIGHNFALTDLRLLYGACDAYVSPYRAEGFNLPPLEAAACGTPIAVTEGGATDDYADPSFALPIAAKTIARGETVMLEPDFDNLVASMTALIEQRTPAIDMAKGSARIADACNWDRAAEQLTALFAG